MQFELFANDKIYLEKNTVRILKKRINNSEICIGKGKSQEHSLAMPANTR